MHAASSEPKIPHGFTFAGIPAGIKVKRSDLMLIASEAPATAAGCFTRSKTRAASVKWCEARMGRTDVRAIVAVSGNANAMAGPEEDAANQRMARAVAGALDVAEDAVLTAATGVIGVPLPVDKIEAATPRLVGALGDDPLTAAQAILTTDTRTKLASREIFLGGVRARVLGIAKGSGMLHPDMATVLGFIMTDAAVAPDTLATMLRASVDASFHMVSVDRDTSTNDAVIALANGMSGAAIVDSLEGDAGQHLQAAILEVAIELAQAVARDGEGARKLVTSTVRGAADLRTARALARAVVESNLVKAALFGADPNPGRILAALGAKAARDEVELDPHAIDVSIQGVPVVAGGAPLELDADAVRAKLRHDEVTILITVGTGPSTATAWGCDLSYDYVRINADYAAVVVDSPGGPVRRDGRLDVRTPELKTEVLVAALRYIERFAGTRAVIRYGATTTERRDLALRLAEDVRLLSAVGLTPILVQESKSELVVTSLARAGVRAVGLSGADGNLLRLVRGDDPTVGRPRVAHRPLASEPPPPHEGPRPWRVDPDVIETLLAKGYVPVVVPEITEELEGRAEPVDVDAVAAEIAVACGAKKLIQMCDAAGIVSDGLLVSELSAEELADRVAHGRLPRETSSRAAAAVRALAGGVDTVHMIDERVPHNVVAELFTETGVGTMVR